MIDITSYSDNELTLYVFYDYSLCGDRHDETLLMDYINEHFIYTDTQMEVLKQDLLDDKEEQS